VCCFNRVVLSAFEDMSAVFEAHPVLSGMASFEQPLELFQFGACCGAPVCSDLLR
jgi:hypothetical protein